MQHDVVWSVSIVCSWNVGTNESVFRGLPHISSMTFSYFANWHLPWHSVTSWTDIFHDIQLLREMTSSMTFSYSANWHLPWHSVTSRTDIFHDIVTPRTDIFHDIQLLRELTSSMTFSHSANWHLPWHSVTPGTDRVTEAPHQAVNSPFL